MGYIDILKEFWYVTGMIALGIARGIKWIFDFNAAKERERLEIIKLQKQSEKEDLDSSELLIGQIEELKIKLVNQVGKELELYKDKAHADRLLYLLKIHCPSCYEQVADNYKRQINEER